MGTRIGRFEYEGSSRWGVVQGNAVVPLAGAYATLRALLEDPELDTRLGAAAEAPDGLPLVAVRWQSPVTRDAQVVCQSR